MYPLLKERKSGTRIVFEKQKRETFHFEDVSLFLFLKFIEKILTLYQLYPLYCLQENTSNGIRKEYLP